MPSLPNVLSQLRTQQVRSFKEDASTIAIEDLFCKSYVVGFCFVSGLAGTSKAFLPVLSKLTNALEGCKLAKDSSGRLKLAPGTCDKTDGECGGFNVVVCNLENSNGGSLKSLFSFPASWFCLPAEATKAKMLLSRACRVRTIPTLVLVDASSRSMITRMGRQALQDDPLGQSFPWYPRNASDLLSGPLLDPTGNTTQSKELSKKFKCIYFSANWCPPCRPFSKKLIALQEACSARAGTDFDVIWCSSDRSQEGYESSREGQPWYSIPYGDSRSKLLSMTLEVRGIPSLVVLDQYDRVVTRYGRQELAEDPLGKRFPWHPKAVLELTESTLSRLKEDISVVLFTDGTPEDVAFSHECLDAVAEEMFASDDQEPLFFLTGPDPVCEQVLELLGLAEAPVPLLAIIDFPLNHFVVCQDDTVSDRVLRTFLANWSAGLLPTRPIRTAANTALWTSPAQTGKVLHKV